MAPCKTKRHHHCLVFFADVGRVSSLLGNNCCLYSWVCFGHIFFRLSRRPLFQELFKVFLFKGNLVQIQGCTWQDIYPNLKFYTKRSESLESDRERSKRYYKSLASQNFSISTGFYASRSL